jgi:diguanylate cyclase (GGDEF)-like protein/putative nucleotidyltransferase with HDIG domain
MQDSDKPSDRPSVRTEEAGPIHSAVGSAELNTVPQETGWRSRARLNFSLPSKLAFLTFAALAFAGVAQTPILSGRDPDKYLCYVIAALVACGLKVRRPNTTGEVSMNYLFVLLALLDLNLRETLVISSLAVVILAAVQRQSASKASPLEKLADTMATLVSSGCSILAAQTVYHWAFLSSPAIEPTLRFVAAAVASYLGFNLPAGALLAISHGGNLRKAWDGCYVWTLPYYVLAGALIGLYGSTRPTLGWQTMIVVLPFVVLFYRTYRSYLRRLDKQRAFARRVEQLYLRTIETLALAIGAKDRQMEGHLQRVQTYASAIGKELKLSAGQTKALEAAALLHDIGKLAVPEHIISKPGRLTPEEFDRMKIHPIVGAEILERVQFPYPVVPYVRHHHERWDGSGYPDGLRGEEIPIGARILAVVDCMDALASDRQYRRALSLERAVEQIALESGRSFDPRIVAILKRRFREFEQLTDEGRIRDAAAAAANPEDSCATLQFERVVQAIGASTAEVSSLFELTQELGNSLNLPETFAVLGPVVKRLVPYSALVIYLKRRDRLYARHVAGDHMDDAAVLELPLGEGVSGVVAATGEHAINGDPARESPLPGVAIKLSMFRSLLALPLSGADSIVGCLTLYHESPEAFTSEHLRRLKAILPKLSQAVENGMKFKQAEDRATTDHLTGLPNAHSLYLHLDQEIALSKCMNSPLTVVVCDLNGFKSVNDTLGHLTGNKLLQAVGVALKESCREYDFVARMGGDEFVLILSGLTTGQDVQTKIRQFRDSVRMSSNKVCREGMVKGSFGVAMFPKNGESADELLAHADREMYRDKEEQKKGVSYNWSTMHSNGSRPSSRSTALAMALPIVVPGKDS